MASLAAQKVIHRDLAARNVLLDSNMEPKVADFGLSRTVSDTSNTGKTATNTGPIRWMDSSALSQTYSEKSDVWAFGCTLFELVTGSIPYPESELIDIAIQVRDQGLTPLSDMPGDVAAKIDAAPEYLITLMKMCFTQEQSKRPSFQQIVEYLQQNAPKTVLRVEEKRRKRREKRQKILLAMDEIAL
jgi:serine/threonine protein kinase